MKISPAAIGFVVSAATANAFSTSLTAFVPVRPGTYCSARPISATSLHVTTSSSTFDTFKELDALGNFDPADEDADEEVTEKMLYVTMQLLDRLQDEKVLKEEGLSPEALASLFQEKSVTTDLDDSVDAKALSEQLSDEDIKSAKSSTSAIAGLASLVKLYNKLKTKNGEPMGFDTYSAHPEYPDVDLSGMPKMMEGAPPLEYMFEPPKIKRGIIRFLRSVAANKLRSGAIADAKSAEEAFEKMFSPDMFGPIPNLVKLYPRPKVVDTWIEDKELGRQYLNGVNPVMLNVATDLQDISAPLVETLGQDRLERLLEEKRLFYVSYDTLGDLKKNPHYVHWDERKEDDARHFHPAKAVFVLSKRRQDLTVVGIQLDPSSEGTVYTKENSTKNEWMFAKAALATADSQYHEWVSHLGLTHFAFEPHIVAIHNTLKMQNHPLYAFVKPLCRDMLPLNWLARKTLAKPEPGSVGDTLSSVGVGQFMQLIVKAWEKYDFFESSGLPSELAARGFTEDFDMPAYLYREDGMKLWDAYGSFTADYVDELYASDSEVSSDSILQEWATETSHPDRGAVPGFPKSFEDKYMLAKTLQTLMWIPSYHAAVNFPQYDFFAHGPNKPLGARSKDFPRSDAKTERDWIFSNFMPDMETQFENTIRVTHILTLPSEHCIDNLSDGFETAKYGAKSYKKLLSKLKVIGNEIESRNKANKREGKAVYSYLHPSNVPASIDI